MVGLSDLTGHVKTGTAEKVQKAYDRLCSGTWDVFYGPLTDNTGRVRVEEGENMSDEALLKAFDWFVEGVVVDE
jgi:basic membrane protein A